MTVVVRLLLTSFSEGYVSFKNFSLKMMKLNLFYIESMQSTYSLMLQGKSA